jgi:hypothetical protein
MKRNWFFSLVFAIILTACANPAIANVPATAIPISTEIPPTETPAPTSTIAQTPTIAPTETSSPTDTPAATPTYDFVIMSTHDQMIDGLIPLELTEAPLTEYCGAPILDTALAGTTNNDANMYYFMTDSHPMDVYKFYMTEMPKQGSELIRISNDMFTNIRLSEADLNQFHSSMQFQNASTDKGVSITIVKDFDNGHIYVWMICGG